MPSITVAGPLLTEKTSLILYVLRTCPARIRPGKRHELPIKEYNVTHNYFQNGWRNCNVRGCPLECGKHFTRLLFPCRRYINNANSGMRDILAKILHIVDKWSNFLSPCCQLLIVMLWSFIPLQPCHYWRTGVY